MEKLLEFLHPALPWIAIGLTLAIFFATKKEKAKSTRSTEGMCFGLLMGTAISTSLKIDSGVCLILGVLIGYIIGLFIKKDKQEKETDEN